MSVSLRASLLAPAISVLAMCAAPSAFAQGGAWQIWPSGGAQEPAPVSRSQRFGGACHDCDLSDRKLPGVRIERGDFARARFTRAFLVRMDAGGSTFTEADFSLANLSDARLPDTQCERARFSGAVLSRVDFSRAQCAGADLSNAEMPDATLVQTRLTGATLSGVKAMRANFLRADLRNAIFAYARLDGADFTQADLGGARLTGATLIGANLAEARRLTPVQLRGACGDAGTRLPPGMRVTPCAAKD